MIGLSTSAVLLVGVLALFVTVGLRAAPHRRAGTDEYVTARGSQGPVALGLSFLASGMGAWILFAPPELGALLGLDAVVGYAVAAAGPFLLLALVGPRLRRTVPSGHGLTEFLRVRFGAGASTVVALLSLLYMGVFLTAELVAVAGMAELLGGVPRAPTVLSVAIATLAYTAYGGLRASLVTDRWQSWLALALLATAATATVATRDPVELAGTSGALGVDRVGVESAITLVIAVTAANMFHHGYWQRVWAAADDRALRRGALLGAAGTVPVVLVAGAFGIVAAGAGLAEIPALSVFALAGQLPSVVVGVLFALGIALVASSMDTLENGLAALLVAERPRLSLDHARLATVAMMVPIVAVSLVATSVLQLFLIADLLCAALVGPALLGLWGRTTGAGVLAGALAGVGGAVAAGGLATGSLAGAVAAVTFPDAVPTLPPFAGALLAGTVITMIVSVAGRRRVELGSLEAAVRRRAEVGGTS